MLAADFLTIFAFSLSFLTVLATHPFCDVATGSSVVFNDLEDITSLLHGKGVLPPSLCVFNPAVLHLYSDLYVWGARSYTAADPQLACVKAYGRFRYPVSYDRGHGNMSLVMAVTRTSRNNRGRLVHELLAYRTEDILDLEDPRMFKDDKGNVWALMYFPPAGMQTVTAIHVDCGPNPSTAQKCSLALGGSRFLWYTGMMKREKNWVPHNGTTRMSYPVYPTFGPHRVFDWGSYEDPAIKSDFDYTAPPDPFFEPVHKLYKALLEFSGSTPAILHDDGQSYIAVGHIRAHPYCFHDPYTNTTDTACGVLASATSGRVDRVSFYNFTRVDGVSTYPHHELEYAMFFYRFSAEPPYQLTHLSHAFIPCSFYHYGITYPSGITRLGGGKGDFLVSFGEADRYCRIFTITAAAIDEMLVPIKAMKANMKSYSLCTVRCQPQHWTRLYHGVAAGPLASDGGVQWGLHQQEDGGRGAVEPESKEVHPRGQQQSQVVGAGAVG